MRQPLLILMLLGSVHSAAPGCSRQPDSGTAVLERPGSSPIVLQASEVVAYRVAIVREIGVRSEAERLGFAARAEMVDSVAAEAAGLPVARYRVIGATIETLLAEGQADPGDHPRVQLTSDAASLWSQQRLSLDSLRLEALVLRARTGS